MQDISRNYLSNNIKIKYNQLCKVMPKTGIEPIFKSYKEFVLTN